MLNGKRFRFENNSQNSAGKLSANVLFNTKLCLFCKRGMHLLPKMQLNNPEELFPANNANHSVDHEVPFDNNNDVFSVNYSSVLLFLTTNI